MVSLFEYLIEFTRNIWIIILIRNLKLIISIMKNKMFGLLTYITILYVAKNLMF